MVDISSVVPAAMQIVSFLIYGAIAIHFLNLRNNGERFKFMVVIAGVIVIFLIAGGNFGTAFYNPQWPFVFTQMILMSFLGFMGIHLMIHKKAILLLFTIFVVTMTSNFFIAFFIGAIAYLIVSFGFIYSALKTIKKWFSTPRTPPMQF